jgi:hypothetical protein
MGQMPHLLELETKITVKDGDERDRLWTEVLRDREEVSGILADNKLFTGDRLGLEELPNEFLGIVKL